MASEVDVVEALERRVVSDVHAVMCAPDELRALLARLHAAEAERDRYLAVMTQQSKALTRAEQAEQERDEARAALAKMEEEHRAAVEALEMYESRIGDIADHVLGLVPPDVPSVVKLDAIERRCGEERVAARQAEARVRELEAMRDVLGSTVQAADEVIIRGSERIAVLERIADAAAACLSYIPLRDFGPGDVLRAALAARGKDGAA